MSFVRRIFVEHKNYIAVVFAMVVVSLLMAFASGDVASARKYVIEDEYHPTGWSGADARHAWDSIYGDHFAKDADKFGYTAKCFYHGDGAEDDGNISNYFEKNGISSDHSLEIACQPYNTDGKPIGGECKNENYEGGKFCKRDDQYKPSFTCELMVISTTYVNDASSLSPEQKYDYYTTKSFNSNGGGVSSDRQMVAACDRPSLEEYQMEGRFVPYVYWVCGNGRPDKKLSDGYLLNYTECKNAVQNAVEKCFQSGDIKAKKDGSDEQLEAVSDCIIKDNSLSKYLNDEIKSNLSKAYKTQMEIKDAQKSCNDGGGVFQSDGSCLYPESVLDETYKTCQVDETAKANGVAGLLVGWIVCPFANFASIVADSFYGFITDDLLKIPSDKIFSNESALAAYHNMLPFANIILAIMFVLVIYSEATGNGFGALSNYTVKKLLPRLVIFAILVNVSWYICAAAIDVSNIIGANIKGFFEKGLNVNSNPSDSTTHTSAPIKSDFFAKGWAIGTVTFTTIMGAALAGHIAGMSILSFLGFMAPLLVAVLVVLIVTWLILVIRQAGVIILCLISPLAIAVGMLPNGKQWTDKWLKAFGALWVTWPAVGLVLGCSSVAAKILEDTGNVQMIIAALAVRILPLGAIPFIVLASLKAFGKAGSVVQKFANRGMRQAGRWNRNKMKQTAGMVKDAAQARAIGRVSENAMKWADPNERAKLKMGHGKGKALAAHVAMMGLAGKYERQASAESADQILKNKFADNYEQKIGRAKEKGDKASWSDRQAQRVRDILNEAEVARATYETINEAKKQKHIATDPRMVELLNQQKAYENQASVNKNEQLKNYNGHVKEGVDVIKKYNLHTLEDVDAAAKAGELDPLQAQKARVAFMTMGAVPTINKLPNVSNSDIYTPEGQTEFSRVLGTAQALSAGQLAKSEDAFKSARMVNLRQMYSNPAQLGAAMKSGQMSKEDVGAGVALLSSVDKDHPYGDVATNAKILANLSVDVHFMSNVDSAKSVVNAMATNSEVKKSMPALSQAAAKYEFGTDPNGEVTSSVLDLQAATDKYGPDVLRSMRSKQVYDLSNEQIDAFAASKDSDVVQAAGDVVAKAMQNDPSSINPSMRPSIDRAIKKSAESYTESAKSAEWSRDGGNIDRLTRSSAVHEFNPELSMQARVHDVSSGGAVADVDLASDASFSKLTSVDDKERSRWSANEVNVVANVVKKRQAMAGRGASVHTLGDRGVVGNFVGSDLFYRGNKSQQAAWRSLESSLR